MGTIPYGLSISHFVNKVGSDAGFAAFIGLAILILLYFAQARETATLREHAAEATERIRQLEGRINQLLRAAQAQAQQAAQNPANQPIQVAAGQALRKAPPPARVAAVAGAASGPPAVATPQLIAPAGVGAPALSAATKLIPTEAPAAVAAPAAPAFEAEVANGGGSNGHSTATVQAPPRPPAPVAGGLLSSAAPTAAGGPPRVQIGGQGPRRPVSNRAFDVAEAEQPASHARRIIAGILALAVVAVIVIVLISVTGGSGGSPAKAGGTRTTNAPGSTTRHRHHGAAAVTAANVDVAVLNGTASAGLAKQISSQLTGHGYKAGCVANALSQTQATTQVAYFPAFRRDAAAVAKALGLPSSDLAAIDSSTQSVTCSPPIGTSNVVVTIGADLARSSTSGASTTAQTTPGAGTGAVAPPSTAGAGTSTAAVPPTGTGIGTNPTNTVG